MSNSPEPSTDPVLQPLWIAADRAGIRAADARAWLAELESAVESAATALTAADAAQTAAKQALAAKTGKATDAELQPLWIAADRAGIRAADARAWLADREAAIASLTPQVTAAEAAHTAAQEALAAAIRAD